MRGARNLHGRGTGRSAGAPGGASLTVLSILLADPALVSSSVLHHGAFTEQVGRAIAGRDLESIRHLFPEDAWEGPAASLRLPC